MSKSAHPTSPGSRGALESGGARRVTTARDWVGGARPRTLPAAVVPVLVGTAVARRGRCGHLVALALCPHRRPRDPGRAPTTPTTTPTVSAGPTPTAWARSGSSLVGLAEPSAVRAASLYAFGIAGVAGLVLALATTPWLLAVGAACFAAGWLYSAGPRPYGYAGFGEVFVFVFFGLVAVVGTAYVISGHITSLAVTAAVPVGLLSTALLVVNNLRDIETDRAAGKKTLAVRSGAKATRILYAGLIAASFAAVVAISFRRPFALLALLAVAPAVPPLTKVLRGAQGRDLVVALAGTGTLQLAFGALLALGIAL